MPLPERLYVVWGKGDEPESVRFSRAAIRGGNWNNGSNAGVFYLNLNNAASNTNTNIGFRAASSFCPALTAGFARAGYLRISCQGLKTTWHISLAKALL